MSPTLRRRLDLELVHRRLVNNRTEAQDAIDAGRVVVGGVPEPKSSTRVDGSASIRITSPPGRFVSRGGDKLAGALRELDVPVRDRRALDAGASTGGFTDCLLQEGAASVAAVDVGYGQLDWSLRNDPRVTVFERINLRHADVDDLGGPFDLIVADLSFISICTVAPRLVTLASQACDLILLVKPQFEVGKGQVGKGGIVRDPEKHRAALLRVIECLADEGLGTMAVTASPIKGTKGNREFFVWARKGARTVQDEDVDRVIGL
ncbi:MAG: TlyA family RNA methyltransferase [Acidimicrobiia bacterium]|nr:TlyA family RNA methyltransferase [Acidimicrobiia bacterium]